MPLKPNDPIRLTHERVRQLLDYEPETGVFTWAQDRGTAFKTGTRAGHKRPDGYRAIYIEGRHTLEHRLAVFWMTGEWPNEYVDHQNEVRDDNRYENLRSCSHQENVRFRSGGVIKTERGDWVANIGCRFETRKEAEAFRQALILVRDNWSWLAQATRTWEGATPLAQKTRERIELGHLLKKDFWRILDEFSLESVDEARPTQIAALTHALQAAERHGA